MIVLLPGTVTVFIPYRLLAPVSLPSLDEWALGQYLGAILIVSGTGILLSCVWSFAHYGRGTLAPFDETRRLVLVGLYKYVRNPMYVGVMLILLGETIFCWSSQLMIYTAIVFGLFNLIIIGYEENRLRHKYGDEYREYCGTVGRWFPRSPGRDSG